MSRSKQIIEQLTAGPSVENIAQAIEWIKGRKRSNKLTDAVVLSLLRIAAAGPQLYGLNSWMKSVSWNWASQLIHVASIEHLDWLLALLDENPEHENAGELWNTLLFNYSNGEIVDAASKWLLDHSSVEFFSASIAASLLEEGAGEDIVQLSRQLLDGGSDEFFLVRALLEAAPDDHTIDIGIEILSSQQALVGCIVAPALMNTGKRGAESVDEFFKRHRKSKHYLLMLKYLITKAPTAMFPLVRDWVKEHPKSRDAQLLLVDLLCTRPTPEGVELLWRWCQSNNGNSDILNVLTIFHTRLPVPPDCVLYARGWLASNLTHSLWDGVLLHVLERSNKHEQLQLLSSLLPRLAEEQQCAFVQFMLRLESTEKLDENTMWSEVSQVLEPPHSLVSGKWSPKRQPAEAQIRKRSPWFRTEHLRTRLPRVNQNLFRQAKNG